MHGQVELGLGPLHNSFDEKDGVIYTSLYVDSQIVKWDYKNLKVLDRINVHYNIGHLDTMEENRPNLRVNTLSLLINFQSIVLTQLVHFIHKITS